MYYSDTEDIPCSWCGKEIPIDYPLNNKGADFESTFLGAPPSTISCPHCGKKIKCEASLEWKITKVE